MKKRLIALLTCSLLIISGISAYSVALEKGSISVNTTENSEIAPDIAEISFMVKTSDLKSTEKATVQNKEITNKVYESVNKFIDTSKGDYIKTSDFNVSPVYNYQNSKKIFERYEISNRIIVHTKSIDNIGKMIDSAIKSGVTNVDSLNFSLSNYDSQCDVLIGKATKKAKNRAELIAKNLGTTLDGLQSFNTSCNANNSNMPRYYMAKNMLAATADGVSQESSSTTISDGVIKLQANVNASFFVK